MLRKTKVAVKITDKNRQKAIDLLLEYGQEFNIADSAEGFLIIARKPYQEKASVWEVDQGEPWELKIINLTKLREILKAEVKEEVEGKWYASHHTDGLVSLLFFCTHVKDNLLRGAGFNETRWLDEVNNGWCNPWDIGGDITKATVQEVETALTGEALRRGHKYEKFAYSLVENALYGYNGRLEEVFVNGKWNEPFDKFAELKEAHKNGEVIQVNVGIGWVDCINNNPAWNNDYEYRIKPEEGEDPYLWGNKIVSEPRDGVDLGNAINPAHYTELRIQPVDYIEANKMDFFEGNVVKYVSRYKRKNGLEDLKKAKYYIDKIIERYEKADEKS